MNNVETHPGTGSGHRDNAEILNVSGLHKSFGETRAVNNVGFSVNRGEVLALLGPNGAGKTTTINLVLGLKPADGGRFEFFGKSRERISREDLARTGVQLQQTVFFPELTVGEVLAFFRSLYKTGKELEELLRMFSLADQTGRQVRSLSGGQRQRLALACALVNNPDLVFLDEPTAGIDTQNRLALWSIVEELKKNGCGIVLTTHYMDEAERLADRVILIDHGIIRAEGTVENLKTAYGKQTLEEVFLEITGRALRD